MDQFFSQWTTFPVLIVHKTRERVTDFKMPSTFQSISDILQLLNFNAHTPHSQATIDKCSNILITMNNILNYEIPSNDTMKCTFSNQENLISNIYKTQQVLHDADTYLDSATPRINNLIMAVHFVFNHRWKLVQTIYH